MSDTPIPNNPYARPIHATRAEGQMLQGEFYGKRADDKKLVGLREQAVASASRFVGRAIAMPVDMDAPKPVVKKERKPRGPKADAVVIDEPPAITEDDLFG